MSEAAASGKSYRPDVDGLRAIAILGVVLFHFGIGPLRGGFVGVDVFLVISGYLIYDILEQRAHKGGLAVAGFLARRLRRLVPALFLVLLACDLAALRILPNDMKPIGTGLMTAATFTSNFFFASLADDYFKAGSLAIHPELHTWSLSLEMQFYAAMALVFALLARRHVLRRRVLVAIGLVSFVLCAFAPAAWQIESFYLLPFRMWEFLGGALVAARLRAGGAPGTSTISATAGALGLALLAVTFFTYLEGMRFPGFAATLPTLGAMLVVYAGARPNPVTAFLSCRPLPQIGKLSYSLYLWHWPLLVFANYGRAEPLGHAARFILLAIAIVLAWLTWRFVERPILERRWLVGTSGSALLAGGLVPVFGLALFINLAGQGLVPLRLLPSDVRTLANGQFDKLDVNCDAREPTRGACGFGSRDSGDAPRILLWGNSFARMWLPALSDLAGERHVAGASLIMSKCPPLVGRALTSVAGCEAFNQRALDWLEAHPEIRTVVLAADWGAWPEDLAAITDTARRAAEGGRHVFVVMSPPDPGFDVPRTLAFARLTGAGVSLPTRAASLAARAGEQKALQAAAGAGTFTLVDPFDAICPGGSCPIEAEGRPLYFDGSHLSISAARRFGAAVLAPVLAAAAH